MTDFTRLALETLAARISELENGRPKSPSVIPGHNLEVRFGLHDRSYTAQELLNTMAYKLDALGGEEVEGYPWLEEDRTWFTALRDATTAYLEARAKG